ncbi:MAG TPA: hypothetical protein PLQ13_01460 [Candidatus Krumholzibacteria bacterium]|nr:hypothetical protein [Candidatus Krumholzibacteria bacterium]
MPAGGHEPARLPRPAALRGCGPGGRRPEPADAASARWELWNLRAFWPDAGPADLAALKARRAAILAREREALAGLWSGDEVILVPGHGFRAAAPDLATGMIVSLHQGPYQLLLELFLDQGRAPLVLASPEARAVNAARADALAARLGRTARVGWIDATDPGDLRRLARAVRDPRQPVVAFLDGNLGEGGYAGTRERGMAYRLPGRDLRVRTGLVRLAARLGVPLHPVAVHWNERFAAEWSRGPVLRPGRRSDPDDAARVLWDWCFGHVMARPEQWRMWTMLKESSACFAARAADGALVPAGLRRDYARAFGACLEHAPRTVRLVLERGAEVWPGDVLVDTDGDRFFAAAGLADDDLEPLRSGQPTLAELCDHHGRAWVAYHGLRLCLLGLARLGG